MNKRKITKCVGTSLLATMIAFTSFDCVNTVYAASTDIENQFDDNVIQEAAEVPKTVTAGGSSFDTAVTITAFDTVNIESASNKTEDYYKFTTSSDNTFYAFDFTNNNCSFYLYDENRKQIQSGSSSYISMNEKLQRNTTYYIKAVRYTNGRYRMQMNENQDDYDDTTFASINTDTSVTGYLNDNIDVDTFQFTTDAKGAYYSLNFKNKSATIGMRYQVYASKDCFKEDCITEGYVSAGNQKSSNLLYAQNSADMRLKPGTTYYIKVSYTNNGPAKNEEYNLLINKIMDDYENTSDKATDIKLNKTVAGKINDHTDKDIFKFTTDDTNAFYYFTLTNIDADKVEYYIYSDEQLTTKVSNGAQDKAKTGKNHIYDQDNNYRLVKDHTYYVVINHGNWSGEETDGDYSFQVSKVTDDYKDTAKEATTISLNKGKSGKLVNYRDVDYFKFKTTSKDDFYTLNFSNTGTHRATVTVYSDDKELNLVGQMDVDTKITSTLNLTKLTQNKTYYVKVAPNYWAGEVTSSSYSLKVVTALDDIKDTVSSAKTLSMNKKYTYALQNKEDTDFFKITAGGFKDNKISFGNLSVASRARIEIYSSKNLMYDKCILNTTLGNKESLAGNRKEIQLTPGKTYYIRITGDSTGKYQLGVSATGPSSVKVANAGSKKVNISWKKLSKATGYEIYRSESRNGTYKRIKKISNSKTLSYKDSNGLKKGKTYYYKVRAYNQDKGTTYSEFSSIKSINIK